MLSFKTKIAPLLSWLVVVIPGLFACATIYTLIVSGIEEKRVALNGQLSATANHLKLGLFYSRDILDSLAQSYAILGPGLLVENLNQKKLTIDRENSGHGGIIIWSPQSDIVMASSELNGTYDIPALTKLHFNSMEDEARLTASSDHDRLLLLLSRPVRDQDEFMGIITFEIEPFAAHGFKRAFDELPQARLILAGRSLGGPPIRSRPVSLGLQNKTTLSQDIWNGLSLATELRPFDVGVDTLRSQALLIAGLTAGVLLVAFMANMLARRESRLLALERTATSKAHELAVALKEMKTAVEARHQAEGHASATTTFLATMSHELRTPMNGVLGMLDALLDTALSEKQHDLAETAQKSASELLVILNDILDYTKLDDGSLEMTSEPFALTELVTDSTSLFRASYEAKGIRLSCVTSVGVPPIVRGDRIRIKQVLYNLLGNALKFTEQGGVEVSISTLKAKAGYIRFEVRDTGIGLTKYEQSIIFERFTQVDSSNSRKAAGTGLGLAISKKLVELMGGAIGVESQHGSGSVFWYEIPLPNAEMSEASVHSAKAEDQLEHSLRILVADDALVNRKVAKLMLEKLGHRVCLAVDGLDAVEKASRTNYDLIFMDIQMPGMDGVEATRRLRESSKAGPSVPIVALTANVLPEQIQEYIAAGMCDHVSKPVRAPALSAAIARVLVGKAKEPVAA